MRAAPPPSAEVEDHARRIAGLPPIDRSASAAGPGADGSTTPQSPQAAVGRSTAGRPAVWSDPAGNLLAVGLLGVGAVILI